MISTGSAANSGPPAYIRSHTKDGDHLVVLDDLQGPGYHEAEGVNALPRVVDQVPWCTVDGLELHSQRAQAAVAGQPEGWMFIEHLDVMEGDNGG